MDASLEGAFELGRCRRLLTLDTLAGGQRDKDDIGIAQVHTSELTRSRHLAAVPMESQWHRLIVVVVPNHRQYRDPVTRLRLEARRTIHDRAVADGRHYQPVWRGQLCARRSTDPPSKRVARI